jgi:NAD(P)-dependent dehydrogenase (short-subunit alcohol dehydrogenase family)
MYADSCNGCKGAMVSEHHCNLAAFHTCSLLRPFFSLHGLPPTLLQVLLGAVDVWICNAGYSGSFKPFLDSDPATLEAVVRTNLLGTLLCAREAGRLMLQQRLGGHIFIMDGAGADGSATPQYAAYGERLSQQQGFLSSGCLAMLVSAPILWHTLASARNRHLLAEPACRQSGCVLEFVTLAHVGVDASAWKSCQSCAQCVLHCCVSATHAGATKAAVPQLAATLGSKLDGTHVGVHVLSPGMMITELC